MRIKKVITLLLGILVLSSLIAYSIFHFSGRPLLTGRPRGCTVSLLQAVGRNSGTDTSPFTDIDYARLHRWNLNTILYEVFWTHLLEPDELQPGQLNEDLLDDLNHQLIFAKRQGLYPFIAPRIAFNPKNPQSWYGWADPYGYDYVNLNLPDASGTLGRDRFTSLLQTLAQRFPDTGICFAFYPYHAEQTNTTQAQIFYEVTIPMLYQAVRAVTDEYLFFHPLHQGNRGDWFSGTTTGQYDVIEQYGYPFTEDPKLIYGFANHDMEDNERVLKGESWNYDYERLREHYEPLRQFKERHPNLSFACGESTPLVIHTQDTQYRPVDPTRLDWLEAQMQVMEELGLGWFYYLYENPPNWASPIDDNGTDNAIAKILANFAREE